MDRLREVVQKIQGLIDRQVRQVNTMRLVVIETVHHQGGHPVAVDVRLKDDPDYPLLRARLVGAGTPEGFFQPPVYDGMVGTAFFSMVPLDWLDGGKVVKLTTDRMAYKLKHQGRWHGIIDVVVFPGWFTENDVVQVPSGYNPATDLLLQNKNKRGVWVKGNNDVVVGKLDGTLKKALVDGDTGPVSGGTATINAHADTAVYVGR